MAKPKWRCAQCGARNDESLLRCRLCKSAAPEVLPGPSPAAAPPLPPSVPAPPEPEPEVDAVRADADDNAFPDYGASFDAGSAAPADTEYDAPADEAYAVPQEEAGYEPPPDAEYAAPSVGAPEDEPAPQPVAPIGLGLPHLPPIGGFGGPDVAPAPPEPPSGPDKRVVAGIAAAAVVAIVVFGVLAFSGGSKSSSTLSPDETVGELLPETTAKPGPDVPTENRAAVAMLPTKADFGDLWSQIELRAGADAFQLGPNPSSAQCVLPPPAVPEAGARVDLGSYVEGGAVAAQVKVFADPTSASKDLNTPPIDAATTSCLQSSATAELGKRGIADFVTVEVGLDALGAAGFGEESFAYRVTSTISAGSLHITQHIDLVGFRIGRTVGQLTVSAGYGVENGPLLEQARGVFTTRFVSL